MGRVSMLCNDAELFQEEGAWRVEGDPTEGALYPFATKLGMDRQAERAAYPRVDAIPFESEHKFMATLHEFAVGEEALLVKGAPEVILEHCDRQQMANGQPSPLDRAHFMQASDTLAAQGERVLALAWLEKPGVKAGSLGPTDLPKTLVLLGLVGLLDPPRKEAIDAVKECHGGGIRVTMITGDHKITAAAIAKMLGIGDGRTAITGAEIEEMDTATLQERVRDVDVFARASPEHKLRLVKAIQANKQIVAMTGDGVNDAPSLKKADIGVAMGIKGTEVTKEAAGMILADDNFASITAAVKEGRTVYNNIEKAMLFLLPTNVAQALVIAVAIFFGFTMPITAPQVLWVNMVTSVALGLGDLLRTARDRRDAAASARHRPRDRDWLRHLAHHIHRLGAACLHAACVLLDEVPGRIGRACADGRGQRHHHRPGILSAEQPLSARLVVVPEGAHGKQVPADGHCRGGGPAVTLHLHVAIPSDVRQRSHSAWGLALANRRGARFLSRRRGRKAHHPFLGIVAGRGHHGGGRGVNSPAAPNCWRLMKYAGRQISLAIRCDQQDARQSARRDVQAPRNA